MRPLNDDAATIGWPETVRTLLRFVRPWKGKVVLTVLFGIARIRAAEPQVVGNAAVEQRRILRDDRDHVAHLVGSEGPHVVAADPDRAALRVVLAQQ
ncbi:hypothetical protein QM306_39200, partial [Burkholderia cenocepacia]|nr:hypothetical protein [Burkholderia cenocepacia]